ncbi:MAG: ParA family protein [Chlamydiae bacterium CG10_big_fil_rev_8_21_14_0_10_35_9]|nr:MAG: ParA family protein [Chlamydiae bacterium CG10_big_fil_rev_8_21_14_0_10_35_9]
MENKRSIAIVNQKGGSGKTTTAVNLASSLVNLGKKVLLIDMDPQGSASLWLGFKEKGRGFYEVLTSNRKLDSAILTTDIKNLYIAPSSPILSGVEKILANEVAAETILKNKLEECVLDVEYILIDCPPTLGMLSLNALTCVKEVIVPVEAHVMALHGLVQLLKTINLVKERLNPHLKISGILPCRVDLRTKHSKEVLNQLNQRFEKTMYKSVIRENVRLAEAPLHLKPISEYDSECYGTKDYMNFAKEVIKTT